MTWLRLIAALAALVLAGCREQVILVDIPQDEAARKMADLDVAGIRASIVRGTKPLTVSLAVPEDAVFIAVQVLSGPQTTDKASGRSAPSAPGNAHPGSSNSPDNCRDRSRDLSLLEGPA